MAGAFGLGGMFVEVVCFFIRRGVGFGVVCALPVPSCARSCSFTSSSLPPLPPSSLSLSRLFPSPPLHCLSLLPLSSPPSASSSLSPSGGSCSLGGVGGPRGSPVFVKAQDFSRNFASARIPSFVPSISGSDTVGDTLCSTCLYLSYLGHSRIICSRV